MGSNTRDLRVRFIGDASALKGTFSEVQAGAAQAAAGLERADVSATNVGKSFSRSGKLFKAGGKVIKNSGLDALSAGSAFASIIPQASGLAAGLGALTVGADALGTTVGAASPALAGMVATMGPLAAGTVALAPLVIAAAGAYALLHDDVSYATEALNEQRKANEGVIRTHRDLVAALREQRDATRGAAETSLNIEDAQARLADANRRVSEALHAGGKSSLEYRDALVKVEAANHKANDALREHGRNSLEYRQAVVAQEKAQAKLTDVEKAGGKGSREYADALREQKRAQMEVGDQRREQIRQAQEFISKTKDTSKAIDDEKEQTEKAADAARKRQLGLQQGFFNDKNREKLTREIASALNAEAKATSASAAKHQANAKAAFDMAKAIGTATPQARALHDQLTNLGRREANLAGTKKGIKDVGSAADVSAGQVGGLISKLNAIPRNINVRVSLSTSGEGAANAPRNAQGDKNARQDEFKGQGEDARRASRAFRPTVPGEASPLTFSDRLSSRIDRRHRDDTTQDKRTEKAARALGAKQGITNAEKLDALAQKAVDEVRRKELLKDWNNTKSARSKVEGRIRILRKRLKDQRASRKAAKKDDQAKWDQRVSETLSALNGLWDQHRAMTRDMAELKAEAADLQFDIGELKASIANLPDATPEDADTGTTGATSDAATPEDFLDAAAAEAALTAGNADDIAVADQRVAHFERSLTAARATGDPRLIAAAAQALKSAQEERDRLKALNDNTDALNANTTAITQSFGGSNVVGYRGQDFVLRNIAPPSSDRLAGMEVGI